MTVGIDVAKVDENGEHPDWVKGQAEGNLRFVGLRCAYGVEPDTVYPIYRKQLDALRIPNFPYLFIVPGWRTPVEQADAALAAVGTFNRRYFPIAIDVEGDRHGLSAQQWLDWVIAVKQRIQSSIGVAPLLYTSKTYWVDPDGMDNLPAPELADCLGWFKYWPYEVDTQSVYELAIVDNLPAPPCPPPWHDQWGIQQYQGDARNFPGLISTCDMDRVRTVRQGDSGFTVAWIQARLPNLVVDGVFGTDTTAAVKAFQMLNGLTSDGIVGLATMQMLAWVAP